MLNKLRLDSTKIYEQTIATYEIAKMIVDFVRGREHYMSIGSEQGNIAAWDDIVIEKDKNFSIHIQVKRQNTDFSTDNWIREQKAKDGQLKELSSLDNAMKSLADWTKDPSNDNYNKEFRLYLPTSEIQIKKSLKIRHFKELQQQHYRLNITTPKGLEDLASKDTSVKKCLDWLESWCGFSGSDHILKMLSMIKILSIGNEKDIEEMTEDVLKDIFISQKVKEVRNKILALTHINSTYTGGLSPRRIIFELDSYLQPGISRWTQFEKQDNKWCISGINDVEVIDEIERPALIIPKLWSAIQPQELKICADLSERCDISGSLLRLVVHQTGNSNTHCVNSALIKERIIDRVGTLGLEVNDLEALSIIENNESYRCEEVKLLSNNVESRTYSENMETTMHYETWNRVSDRVDKLINGMMNTHSVTLQEQVEQRWDNWKISLKSNINDIRNLFMSIINPSAESESIEAVLRVGMRTVQLLADSIFDLLVVAVALDPDNNGNWMKISDNRNVVAIGLRYWGGTTSRRREVRAIYEDGGIISGKETANIVIFSKVTSSPNEMFEDLLSYSKNKDQNTIIDGKVPDLILTRCLSFKRLIDQGDIEMVRKYIDEQIRVSKFQC